MKLWSLLNQNVDVESEQYINSFGKLCYRIILRNKINKMELAVFESESIITSWGNPGGYMTKEQYDKSRNK